jgi:hypothetical protein
MKFKNEYLTDNKIVLNYYKKWICQNMLFQKKIKSSSFTSLNG